MKVFLATLLLAASTAHAEIREYNHNLDLQCGPQKEVIEKIVELYGERLVMSGTSSIKAGENKAVMGLFVNAEKQTYSWVAVFGEKEFACLMDSGRFTTGPKKPSIKI